MPPVLLELAFAPGFDVRGIADAAYSFFFCLFFLFEMKWWKFFYYRVMRTYTNRSVWLSERGILCVEIVL